MTRRLIESYWHLSAWLVLFAGILWWRAFA